MRKNSFKRIFAALALSAVATTSVASISAFAEGEIVPLTPGPQEDGSFNFVQKDGTIATYTADEIAGAATKPTLSMSKITLTESEAKALVEAGESVDVELTVSGAHMLWCSTGIHMFYDERLVPALDPFGNADLQFGAAAAYLSPMSEENKTGVPGVFSTTGGSDNKGLDGVMWTMSFGLPEDVKAGDVFALNLEYVSGDLFTNSNDDLDGRLMQAYTFVSGLDDGYIEIVEDPTVTTTTTAVTTTTTAAATTTTTAKAGTTTTAKPTTTGKATTTTTGKKTDSPKTGVAGVGVAAAGLVVAAGAAFVLRKKED